MTEKIEAGAPPLQAPRYSWTAGVKDGLTVAGCVSIFYGFFVVWPPLAFVVSGFLVLWLLYGRKA